MAYTLSRREGRSIDPFEDLRRQMDELFQDFTELWPGRISPSMTAFAPEMDVDETEKEICISAELPGIDPKDVSVSVARGAIEVRGEKREERTAGRTSRRVRECRFGKFQRTISLPPEADTESIKAQFKNGLLSITIPKKQQPGAGWRKIEVSDVSASGAAGAQEAPAGQAGGGVGRREEVKGSGVYPPGEPHPPKDVTLKAERAWGRKEEEPTEYGESSTTKVEPPPQIPEHSGQ